MTPHDHTLTLDGDGLTVGALAAWLDADAAGTARVAVSPDARAALERGCAFRRGLGLSDDAFYGINTGFGRFARTRVDADRAAELQVNLVRSHSAGSGERLDDGVVRLMMVLRVNALLAGHSGVRPELVDHLVAMLNAGVVPCVPSRGSVGASGDLAPLAHVALCAIGEGRARVAGREMPAHEALAHAGLEPLVLEPREGLALINGTQLMTAFAVTALVDLRRVLAAALCAAAMSTEAYRGTDRAFDARIARLKRHPGTRVVADAMRRLMADSAIVASHRDCDRVQDPYSFRCVPQVLGAVLDTMTWVTEWVDREINAVTDNPLLFPDDGDVLSGGNFHGEHVAMALDALAVAACEIGAIAERRIDKLVEGDDDVLPRCLVPESGVHSGLMIAQYLAAALASENKVYAHPASVDTIPTSMGFEDHVSMGSVAALKLPRVVDNVARIVAVELLCAAQALDYHRGLAPGRGSAAAHAAVRERVPFIERDTVVADLVAPLVDAVRDGSVVRAAEAAVGPLPGTAPQTP